MEHVDPLMGIILPYVNFFIFLGLGIYFFRKPARSAALKKHQEFQEAMNAATAAKDEADRRLAELEKRHQQLDQELAAMKAAAQNAAETEAAQIVADARRLGEHLKQEAQRIASAEVEKARFGLRREIVEAVRQKVAEKIQSEVGEREQVALVKKRIADLNTLKVEG